MNDEAILTAEQLAMWQEYVGGGYILNEYTIQAVASRLSWLEDENRKLRHILERWQSWEATKEEMAREVR